jgi:hypothetical protein
MKTFIKLIKEDPMLFIIWLGVGVVVYIMYNEYQLIVGGMK